MNRSIVREEFFGPSKPVEPEFIHPADLRPPPKSDKLSQPMVFYRKPMDGGDIEVIEINDPEISFVPSSRVCGQRMIRISNREIRPGKHPYHGKARIGSAQQKDSDKGEEALTKDQVFGVKYLEMKRKNNQGFDIVEEEENILTEETDTSVFSEKEKLASIKAKRDYQSFVETT